MTSRPTPKDKKRTEENKNECEGNAPTQDENIMRQGAATKQRDEYTDRGYEDAERSLENEERHSG